MYIINGIAYAGKKQEDISVSRIKILDDLMLLVTFSTGEQRLFDVTRMFEYPAFKILGNEEVFRTAVVEYGVVTWNDGEIDLAPETMYEKSYAYQPVFA